MRICATIAVLACALLVIPAGALAQSTAPPGNSEVDEYTETLPGAGGDNTIDRSNDGDPGVLSPAAEAELNQLGADGRAAADLAKATAPKGGEKSATGSGEGDDGSALAGITDALGGGSDDGMGWLLPAALIGTFLAGVLFVLLRRRAGHAA